MSDYQDNLHRFIFEELDIRGELVYLGDCWQKVQENFAYPETVRQQLGEAMAAGAILSATIKYEGSLILQIQGDGPITTLVVQASNTGNLRGLAKWQGVVPAGNLGQVYGSGQMAMTISNDSGERYQSIVPLEGEGLATALEHYFQNSEQLQSRFWLFVSPSLVAGLFLQQLPGHQTADDSWNRVTTLAESTTAEEILSLPPQQLLHRLFHAEQVRLFEPSKLAFSCSCSRQKIENTLFSLGRESMQELLEEQGQVEVDCEFCNKHYSFSQADIDALFTNRGSGGGDEDQILH